MTKAQDEVDRIIQAWSQELPQMDTTPMAVLSRVTRLSRLLDLQRRQAFMDSGLDTWVFDVLSCLRRAGKPYSMTPGQLMNELLVSSGTMTNRIDRLVEAGLVQRSPSPYDRRAVFVTLTETGKQRVDQAILDLVEHEREMLAPLSAKQQQTLANLLRPLLLQFTE